MNAYAKMLSDQDYLVNGITFIITDGDETLHRDAGDDQEGNREGDQVGIPRESRQRPDRHQRRRMRRQLAQLPGRASASPSSLTPATPRRASWRSWPPSSRSRSAARRRRSAQAGRANPSRRRFERGRGDAFHSRPCLSISGRSISAAGCRARIMRVSGADAEAAPLQSSPMDVRPAGERTSARVIVALNTSVALLGPDIHGTDFHSRCYLADLKVREDLGLGQRDMLATCLYVKAVPSHRGVRSAF
jgi:hypothetical protein